MPVRSYFQLSSHVWSIQLWSLSLRSLLADLNPPTDKLCLNQPQDFERNGHIKQRVCFCEQQPPLAPAFYQGVQTETLWMDV